ncbi:hypothetical protein GF351_06485 [Candidatus Woesearchaeota archaeon]|nr:hypothetical protein [Candidatus Woesearchaeota archaeon]
MKNKGYDHVLKVVLSAVAFFSYLLLNLAFLLDFLYWSAVRRVIMLFTPVDPMRSMQ